MSRPTTSKAFFISRYGGPVEEGKARGKVVIELGGNE